MVVNEEKRSVLSDIFNSGQTVTQINMEAFTGY